MYYTLGIDLGTTGVRSILYDKDFNELGDSYVEYPLIYGQRDEVEQDANIWWKETRNTIKAAIEKSKIDLSVASVGIAISSQGISVVPTDKKFNTLYNSINWLDQRANEETQEILKSYSHLELYNITGKRVSPAYTLPKLMWLQKHTPEVWNEAKYFLLPQDYLVAKFTGKAVTDHTLASGTMMYSLSLEDWDDSLLSKYKIPREKLPEIMWGGSYVGKVLSEVAKELGIPEDSTVMVGAQDQKCASYAVGLHKGVATISMGTSSAIEIQGKLTKDASIPFFNYLAPNEKVLEGVLSTSGMALRWLRESLMPDISYKEMDRLAELKVGKSRAVFFPYLTGEGSPGWDENATGHFHGITLESDRGDFVFAVLVGVALEINRNLEAMGKENCEKVHIFGGGAKSPVWCQIISNCIGLPVHSMKSPETACLGAAMLAAEGMGIRKKGDPSPAEVTKTFTPEAKHLDYFRQVVENYQSLYSKNHI